MIRKNQLATSRVTWGKAPPFGDDLSLTYLHAVLSIASHDFQMFTTITHNAGLTKGSFTFIIIVNMFSVVQRVLGTNS